MKIIHKIFMLLTIVSLFASCDDEGDVFTGSPIGTNVQFVALQGQVSTDATNVVAAQSFPVTVTLPQTFPYDVSVEVITFLPNSNKRARKYFVIPAGQTTKTDLMNAPNPDTGAILPFSQPVILYLNAISNASSEGFKGFSGVQYSLSSNVVEMNYGDSSIVTVNSNRYGFRLDWLGPYSGSSYNNLNLRLKRGDGSIVTVASASQTAQPIHGTISTNNGGRYKTINFLSTAPDDVYTIEVYAAKLVNPTMDLPFRITNRFPDESTQVYAGTLTGLTVTPATSAIPLYRITKTTDGNGEAHYDVQPLF